MKTAGAAFRWLFTALVAVMFFSGAPHLDSPPPTKPLSPLVARDKPVDWFFVFKFNADAFPGCSSEATEGTACVFGGKVQHYITGAHSQQYAVATNENPTLVKGDACIGTTLDDPLGATFAQVYLHNDYNYVIWNDQFKGHPAVDKPQSWAHSKGMLAWDKNGDGFFLQVTTPSWPASGSVRYPRKADGNTLGCVDDNNVMFSQHFFCLRINKTDLLTILNACINASVVTDPADKSIVKNGGPPEAQALVKKLNKLSPSTKVFKAKLSTNVVVISKPHGIKAAPWQVVSASLDAVPLRVASWWQRNKVCSTTANTAITCWPADLNKPGPVQIATTGKFEGKTFGLWGGHGSRGNHAKIGVTMNSPKKYSIFGDMNQEGTLLSDSRNCAVSQNPRGGMFFVVDNEALHASVTLLLAGESGGTHDCEN